ncbi:hypothetical protein X560_2641 [Listeria fleischmannii 1991]|uniref:Uncharacterized protein n=1 Tax=Listeria fleischmannii 1991 TaxID=1430899 RepID=A0A0J8G5H5_9LIST|nr:hypothetical protein X560_2641 [Listeria fleischmannii 1991]
MKIPKLPFLTNVVSSLFPRWFFYVFKQKEVMHARLML